MAQAQRTINEVILRALSLVGVITEGEVPSGGMMTEGLYTINDIINQFSADSMYIPFQTNVEFTAIYGKDTYSFSDIFPADVNSDRIVDLIYANYTWDNVIYPVRIINKAQYYNITRLTDLNARPSLIFLNKQAEESFITMYPHPDNPYLFDLGLKVMINQIQQSDLLTAYVPPYYDKFFRYALAREFKAIYPSGNWPETNEAEYQRMFYDLKHSNEVDMTIRPSILLNPRQQFYWQNILAT